MANVTGRWALVLLIFVSVPTLITHLLAEVGLVTVVSRTSVAVAGSLAIGFSVEWYVRQIMEQSRHQRPQKGQHIDLQVGPDQEHIDLMSGPPVEVQQSQGERTG